MKDRELDYSRRSGKLDYLDKSKLLDSLDDISSNGREMSRKFDDMVSNGRDISDNLDHIAEELNSSGRDVSKKLDNIQNKIVSTGRKVSGKLDDIHDVISYSYADLKTFFQYAHAESMWIHEKQLEILTGIHKAAINPRATESNELFVMATKALDRGMIKDSFRLLEDSIKLNPLDYRVYMTMGYIYLMSNNLAKAFEMYELAFRNVQEPKYQSFTLLQMANVKYLARNIKEAVKYSENAVKLTPNDPEVRFQYVIYEAQNL